MNSKRISIAFCSFVWIVVFVLDRMTKYLAMHYLSVDYSLTQFLRLHKIFNHGISWGLLHDANPVTYTLLSGAIALLLLMLAGYATIRWLDNRVIIGELLILAGGLSNLFDRVCYGAVIDFILCSWGPWSFPVFNVADIAIVLGVGIMFYDSWYDK